MSPCGGGGATTVSSVGLAFSTSAGCPEKVTAFCSGSGMKPRPRSATRSPIAPRFGLDLDDQRQPTDVDVERARRRPLPVLSTSCVFEPSGSGDAPGSTASTAATPSAAAPGSRDGSAP